MRPIRAWLSLTALLTLAIGCGDELTAKVDIDMASCFVVEGGRRGDGRALNGEHSEAVCVAGMAAGPQTMCLALRVGKKDLPTAKFSYTVRGDGQTFQLSGGAVELPELAAGGEEVAMRPFFLKDGSDDCSGVKVSTLCDELDRCLFSFGQVVKTVKGNDPIVLKYGEKTKGFAPCAVTCNRTGDLVGNAYSCWLEADEIVERCDGLDNDCDGTVDDIRDVTTVAGGSVVRNLDGDALALGAECTGVGACGEDAQGAPLAGQVVCVADPNLHPKKLHTCCSADPDCPALGDDGNSLAEICDGRDNDCDGQTDEGFPVGQPCAGKGVCTGGVWECDPERPALVPGTEFSGVRCSTMPAVAGGQSAGSANNASEDICDDLDNDCDGSVDEDYQAGTPGGFTRGGREFNLNQQCDGIGECALGLVRCHWSQASTCCTADPDCVAEGHPGGARAELCDNIDNDCDGETDEGIGWLDPDGVLVPLSDSCQDPASGCGAGTVVCGPTGAYACCSTVAEEGCPTAVGVGRAELCDGLDNDCDGQTDEDFVQLSLGAPCVGRGICGEGTNICSADAQGVCCSANPDCCDENDNCESPTLAEEEVCDVSGDFPRGQDNDCDGLDDVAEGRFSAYDADGNPRNLGDRCRAEGICGWGQVECGCAADAPGGCQHQLSGRCSTEPGGSASPAHAEWCNVGAPRDDDCDGVADVDEVEIVEGQELPLWRWQDPVHGVWLGLNATCGGVGRCGQGLVACACPPGQPDCAESARLALCSTMPGGPFSEAFDTEMCNGEDDDCDGDLPDDEHDPEGDGYLTCRETTCMACVHTEGGVEVIGLDAEQRCPDTRLLLPAEAGSMREVAPNPGNVELCDGLDNNCSGSVDEGFNLYTSCGRGVCAGGRSVCNRANPQSTCCSTEPGCLSAQGLAGPELCDGRDNNCDGDTPLDERDDGDGDGVPLCGEVGCMGLNTVEANTLTDVHPAWPYSNPPIAAAPEICDRQDNDCDGVVPADEFDLDQDGLLLCEELAQGCRAEDDPDGRVRGAAWGARIHPAADAPEAQDQCDGADNDCDGEVDDGFAFGTSALHCGGCNNACALPNTQAADQGNECLAWDRPGCVGQDCCAVLRCSALYYDINQLDEDGCEYRCLGAEGALDPPSALGEATPDANCDGIDGDFARAVFVSPDGDDQNQDGTMDAPVATLARGLQVAVSRGRNQVLVAAGDYVITQPLGLVGGIGIYGGYCPDCVDADAPLGWKRGSGAEYDVTVRYQPAGNEPYAIIANQLVDQEVYLDRLSILGADARSTGSAASSVGLYLLGSTGVVVRDATIQAGAGFDGANGQAGAAGAGGGAAVVGSAGAERDPQRVHLGCGDFAIPAGGAAGQSPAACGASGTGGPGGAGGIGGADPQNGEPGTAGTVGNGGAVAGTGGTPANPTGGLGGTGGVGAQGDDGPGGGGLGTVGASNYLLPAGGTGGTEGRCGAGGGGGAGGRGGVRVGNPDCLTYGGGGGGGGGGGAGGGVGTAGTGGGASVAILLWNSRVRLAGQFVTLRTAGGGDGGNCGSGGAGGAGGLGRSGGAWPADHSGGGAGGRGGDGGTGGRGGASGAGGGGPSIGIFSNGGGNATIPVSLQLTIDLGQGGAGGTCAQAAASAGSAGQRAQCFDGNVARDCR